MARHPRWVRRFLDEADLAAVAAAVATAEAATSAEIRVHLDARCPGEALARAALVFERLGMHRTAARHGVLVYVSIEDRKLAVLGDRGIQSGWARPTGTGWSSRSSRTSAGSGSATASCTRSARWARCSGSISRAGPTTSTSCPIG